MMSTPGASASTGPRGAPWRRRACRAMCWWRSRWWPPLTVDRSRGVDRAWWSGRSSKPRRRRLRQLRWVRFPHAPATFLLLMLAALAVVSRADAQAPDTAARRSPSAVHQLKPLPAFFQSLAIPGWAQSKLDRKLTGSLFVLWEGVTLGMFLKAGGEVRYLQRTGADATRLDAKRRERHDWLV